jgi:hypothetical protein
MALFYEILDAAEEIIKNCTPDYRPQTPFHAAQYDFPLDKEKESAPHGHTRKCQVLSAVLKNGPIMRWGTMNGQTLANLLNFFVVSVSYEIPPGAGRYKILSKFVGQDIDTISLALVNARTEWGNPPTIRPSKIAPRSYNTETTDEFPNGIILNIFYEVTYQTGGSCP